MIKQAILPFAAAIALAAGSAAALAQTNSNGNMMDTMSMHDRYGGPTYTAAPDLPATISFVVAGGGPTHFSTAKALTALVGPDLTKK